MSKIPLHKESEEKLIPTSPDPQEILFLLEHSDLVYFSLNIQPELHFNYISPGMDAFCGYTPSEIIQNPSIALSTLDPFDIYKVLTHLSKDSLHIFKGEIRISHKNGEKFITTGIFRGIVDNDGKVQTLEGLIKTKNAIDSPGGPQSKENQSLLSNILSTATDAILVMDRQWNIFHFNQAAEQMFKCTVYDAVGKNLKQFVSDPQFKDPEHACSDPFWTEEPRESTGFRFNRDEFPIEISLSCFQDCDVNIYSAVIRDISSRKQMENELRILSARDGLTGLYNRSYFQAEIDRLEQNHYSRISILMADVDGLKYVNDNFGHLAGDELLKTVAQAIRSAFRNEDIVARLGGDEFGIILRSDSTGATSAIGRIYDNLQRINQERLQNPIEVSIGYATALENETLVETIKRADEQMYAHKRRRTAPPRLPD